jgi:hypothetical protein
MTKFYVQMADNIVPLVTATSLDHAKKLEDNHKLIVETDEDVYLNIRTGSVGFASDWDNLDEVVKATYDRDSETWQAAA